MYGRGEAARPGLAERAACAVVAASVKNGICSANTEITVTLIGGDLKIVCSDDYRITMRGAAVKVYDGVFDTDDFDI